METVLDASHVVIMREYLSEFADDNLIPLMERDTVDDDYNSSTSCLTSPTSQTKSFPTYYYISLTFAGYHARPRRATQGHKQRYRDV